MIEYDTETNSNIIANVDETPIVLEPIITTTLEKIGTTTVKIHSFGRHKQRISCLLCVLGNGYKLVPTLVFKGVNDGSLEKRLKNHPEVKKGNINIKCQINSWVNKDIFIEWLKNTWFRTYSFKPATGTILYMDRAKSHLTEDIFSLFKDNNSIYRLIPPGLTSYCQPLDLSINKPFKDALKLKYRNFCIEFKNTKKPKPEDMINWVSEVWWSDTIKPVTIQHSFKKAGINLKLDNSEDYMFNWPKQPDYILIEDLKKNKGDNLTDSIDYSNENINPEISDSEEDILFDYDRYDIKCIRQEVKDSLSEKDNILDEDEKFEKNYNYYYSYGWIK